MGYQSRNFKLAIGAGGTGGHIIPALAFANWLKNTEPQVDIKFFCGSREIEKEVYNVHSFTPYILPIEGSPMWGSPLQRTKRLWRLIMSFGITHRQFKRWMPDAVIVFGGYVSLPLLYASLKLKLPVFVHEQNVVAGKVTKLASMIGITVLSGWEKLEGVKKYKHVGVPVREFQYLPRLEAWHKLNIGGSFPSGPIVLSLGGSLFSEKMQNLTLKLAERECFKEWFFLSLGNAACPKRLKENVCLLPRTWEIYKLYSLADIVITRAGASTLAELVDWNIPAVIVPWLQSADGHQLANAKLFERNGYGRIWMETENNIEILERNLLELNSSLPKKGTRTSRRLGNRPSELIWMEIVENVKGDVNIDSKGQ